MVDGETPEAEAILEALKADIDADVDRAEGLPLVLAMAEETIVGERRENAEGGC